MSTPVAEGDDRFNALLHLFVEVAPELLSVLKEVIAANSSLEARLGSMEGKLDAIVVKEIQSAFKVIDALNTIDSSQMRQRHLDNAEGMLLRHIGLDPKGKTMDRPNTYWVARSYYGLSCVSSLRREEIDCVRFLFRMFATDPRCARKELAPDVFTRVFRPSCQDLYEHHEAKMTRLPQYVQQREGIQKKLSSKRWKQMGVTALGVAAVFLTSGAQRGMAMGGASRAQREASQEVKALEEELALIPTKEAITEQLDLAVDQRCRDMAESALSRAASNGSVS